MIQKAKVKVYELVNGRGFSIFVMTLIVCNVVAVILETEEDLSAQYGQLFWYFELSSVFVFTIEYILRLWICTAEEKYKRPILGRIIYVFTPLALIDLLAILPFYLPMIFTIDLRSIRTIRLIRLFRIFKMGRYSLALKTLGNVFRLKKEELLITISAVMILLVLASGLMYFFESAEQPEAFSSITRSMWWGVATLTTVGYGDVYPITPTGKLLGAIIAILGIGMFALPAGILGSGFIEEIQKRSGNKVQCPHCGKKI